LQKAFSIKVSMGVILIGPKGRAPMVATDNHMQASAEGEILKLTRKEKTAKH